MQRTNFPLGINKVYILSCLTGFGALQLVQEDMWTPLGRRASPQLSSGRLFNIRD